MSVGRAVAQRGHGDLEHAKPIVEIGAERACGYHVFEMSVRRCDDARLSTFGALCAHGIVFALLHHAQQFRLKLGARITDLVEKDRSSSRELEPATSWSQSRR
jgi:hypothetical protein